MSHSYFVSPRKETDLHLDPELFSEAVMRNWLGGEYQFIEDEASPYAVRWSIPMPHSSLTGAFRRNGHSIAVQADITDAAEFARWFRAQVPKHCELAFYDEDTAVVDLTDATTVDELVRPFLAEASGG